MKMYQKIIQRTALGCIIARKSSFGALRDCEQDPAQFRNQVIARTNWYSL